MVFDVSSARSCSRNWILYVGKLNTFSRAKLLVLVAEIIHCCFQCYSFGQTGENLTMGLRLKVFGNLLRQDVTYFDDELHSTGKICTRLATDAPNVKAVNLHIVFRF